jgi:hypothetical protein
MNDFERTSALRSGRYDEVIADMQVKSKFVKDKDYLLHQLNYAMVLHYAGRYQESNKVFSGCQQYVDYGSDDAKVSKALGIVINSGHDKYPIDEYEVLSISFFKMLNALNMGNIELAQAESRRLERVGNLLAETRKSNLLEETAFHTYFSGIIWEGQKTSDWTALDTSYVNYKKSYNSKNRKIPYLPFDLVRLATQLNRANDLEYWQKQFSFVPQSYIDFVNAQSKPTAGEVIIVFTYSLGPMKGENPNRPSTTMLIPRSSTVNHLKITIDDKDKGETYPAVNFDDLAEANYKNRWNGVLGTVGSLVGVESHDYRTWEYLPKEIQVARVMLPAGQHEVILEVSGGSNVIRKLVQVKAGKKTIIHVHEPH